MTKNYTKNETKQDEYIAKIIHDLKTPTIAQIKALESFLLTAKNKISQEEEDLIELTLNSCKYMQKLIEIFSTIHILKDNGLKLNYEKFNITNLIKENIAELNILLKYNELKISFNCDKEIIINADKLQIKRVIENLISNSINYAFKNSIVEITALTKNNEFTFEIKNNSPYIEKDFLKELFQKYKTQKLSYDSTNGLGLYLSQEIVKAHCGNMYAKSTMDDINIFGFIIPST